MHALYGNDWLDHTEYAYWLGAAQTLITDIFKDG
ncbi:MAG: DOPA 4,5-dioxygenase family protein [Acidiferrobacterales bacterium]|nr:DOPA 4,5-dioxygenase family protein [Acidiferrobacterales bacterium]